MDKNNIFNQNICQECGLNLILHSYEKEKINYNCEKIFINLFCQNREHKRINQLKFEDYSNNILKCMICKMFIDKNSSFYCYTCKKIICSDCVSEHKKVDSNIVIYNNLKNKCLIHYENNIIYYCFKCKRNMCKFCVEKDLSHLNSNDIKSINELANINQNNIKIIQEEIKRLQYLIDFDKFLIEESSNYFHLLNNYNNSRNSTRNSIQNIIPRNSIQDNIPRNSDNNEIYNEIEDINYNNKQKNRINIIYHNENLKENGGNHVIWDCKKMQKETKANLILTNDLKILELVLNFLLKIKTKSKFLLVVNGRSAKNVIEFINKNNYRTLFINGCIYTKTISNYEEIKKKNSDFIEEIFDSERKLFHYIKSYNHNTKNFLINSLLNKFSNEEEIKLLYKELYLYYGDESEKTFYKYFTDINNFVKNEEMDNKIKNSLINCFKTFSELNNKNYEKIIHTYMDVPIFAKYLNSLLSQKDLSIYKKIGYFGGNLIYSLVNYGRNKKKEVNTQTFFYNGRVLNIIELLEFLNNKNKLIVFPYFLSMTTRKDLAELSSKRNINNKNRKDKFFFSVIIKIKHSLDDSYKPCAFELKDLSQSKEEEEYILLPFTFLLVKNVIINTDELIADIELDICGFKKNN